MERPNLKGAEKLCFVTIGATASFDALINAVLEPPFIQALEELKYTCLELQHGTDGAALLQARLSQLSMDDSALDTPSSRQRLKITGFDFQKSGLRPNMVAAKTGVVISHAGSGSVLDALRVSAPLILVPNTTLLDNHQEELAEEMARQGYAVHGDTENLVKALRKAEILRQRLQEWPGKSNRGKGKGLIEVMDQELGFVDVDETAMALG